MIFGGVDKTGSRVFGTHPSGTYRGYKARAEGAGRETVLKVLKEEYRDPMKLEEATKLAIKCLVKALQARQLPIRVKIATIPSETKKWEILSEDQVKKITNELGMDV
jgi:20S proteasome alpha/beta subunit